MSFVKIYLHTVWTTKDRFPCLNDKFRPAVFDHIRENAKSKDICIDHLNGVSNHVHCLISMKAEQNIANILHLIKGESSHWINLQKFIKEKFLWQDEYFAVSIGESQLDAVRSYIRTQEEHHKKKTFQQEYDEFMEKYGFSVMRG
jgi:REP element-mobilizing transposase RayT